MCVPTTAKNGKHRFVLNWERKGYKSEKVLTFNVKNKGSWDKDKLAEKLKKDYKNVVLLQNGLACKELKIKDYSGIEETYIFSTHRVHDRNMDWINFGAKPSFSIGVYSQTAKGMMKFDLSKVSEKSKVAKAYLKIYNYEAKIKSPAITVHEVLKDWGTGKSVGNLYRKPQILKGEVSWQLLLLSR